MRLGLPLMKDVTLSSVKYVAGSLKFLGTYGAMNTLKYLFPGSCFDSDSVSFL